MQNRKPIQNVFSQLLRDGADFQAIDKVMEKFGWPMGPAYLMDVVGMYTAVHAAGVMAEGFPDRMKPDFTNTTSVLVDAKRYGQKTGAGYYTYAPDKKGKPKKSPDPQTYELIKGVVAGRKEFTPDEIIARCMVPMVNEVVRCLEEKIVASAAASVSSAASTSAVWGRLRLTLQSPHSIPLEGLFASAHYPLHSRGASLSSNRLLDLLGEHLGPLRDENARGFGDGPYTDVSDGSV